MSITSTGDGLTLCIKCEYLPHHHWMTFASWYSVQKNLPDANVFIRCVKRHVSQWPQLFEWATKVGVDFKHAEVPETDDDLYVILPSTLAVRDWEAEPKISYPNEQSQFTFVDYGKGWGNFVVADWINRKDSPFSMIEHFKTNEMTANEKRIIDIWRQLIPVYTVVG